MRGRNKENVMAVCAIVLCFMLTLGLCFLISGEGIIGAVTATVEAERAYAVAVGGYEDMTLARSTSELIRSRGGAGYIVKGEQIEIIYSVYASKDDADSVLNLLEDSGAYIKNIDIKKSKLKWAKEHKEAVNEALLYYKIAFDVFYEVSSGLNSDELGLNDASVKIAVLRHRLEDIKTQFFSAVGDADSEQLTQVKLALVTALALADNIVFSSQARACADIRYQLVQLVLCRQALMNVI